MELNIPSYPAPNAFVTSTADILQHLKTLQIPLPERNEKHPMEKAFIYGERIRDFFFNHGVIEDEKLDPLICVQQAFWFSIENPSRTCTWTQLVRKVPDLYKGILKLRKISESHVFRACGKEEFIKMNREKSVAELNDLIAIKYVENEMKDLFDEINALKIKVEKARDGMAYYKGQTLILKEELEREETEIETLSNTITDLRQKLEEELTKKTNLEVEINKTTTLLQEKLYQKEQASTKFQEVISTTESMVIKMQDQKTKLDSRIDVLTKTLEQSKEENETLRATKEEHIIKISKLNQQVKELEKCIEKQEVLIEWKESEKKAYQEELQAKEAEKKAYRDEVLLQTATMEREMEEEKLRLMETYGDLVKNVDEDMKELGRRLNNNERIKHELFQQIDMLGKEKRALSDRVNELEGDIDLCKLNNEDLREENDDLMRRVQESGGGSSSTTTTLSFRALVWKGVCKLNKERFEKEKGKMASEIKFNLSRKEEYKKQANTFMIENNTTKQKLAKIQSEMATLKRNRVDLEEVAAKAVEKVVKKLKI